MLNRYMDYEKAAKFGQGVLAVPVGLALFLVVGLPGLIVFF